MADPRDILLSPVISEKASHMAGDGIYTFKVSKAATKPEIRIAVEDLFGVKVGKVNILNRKGVYTRSMRTRRMKRRPSYKRAMVQVVEGEIDLYGL